MSPIRSRTANSHAEVLTPRRKCLDTCVCTKGESMPLLKTKRRLSVLSLMVVLRCETVVAAGGVGRDSGCHHVEGEKWV